MESSGRKSNAFKSGVSMSVEGRSEEFYVNAEGELVPVPSAVEEEVAPLDE